ncbi:MAG: hypothetical protein OK422_03755 [Thaumarchaeota archaeon]|nr:hypothetical protein [Nitrososphaerota archaeon]
MELKPAKGLKVVVNATREAVFGEESVDVRKVSLQDGAARIGTLTGVTLAGYCEMEMPALDGKKHWYPIDDLKGERGEPIVEEEIQIEIPEDDEEEEE